MPASLQFQLEQSLVPQSNVNAALRTNRASSSSTLAASTATLADVSQFCSPPGYVPNVHYMSVLYVSPIINLTYTTFIRTYKKNTETGLAPETFDRQGSQSAVHTQPHNPNSELQALRAAAACPTGSIRTETPNHRAKEANLSFPLPAENTLTQTSVRDVFYNGFASPHTFGGASWLVLHRGENDSYAVMFDCPRYFGPLAKRIEEVSAEVGGVRYLVLSHQDDVAGHDKWAKSLGAIRVIHEKECNRSQGTDGCEVKLKDADFPYELAEGTQLVHVPGHTAGSIAMLHRNTQSLFTGDHVMYRRSDRRISGGAYSRERGVQIESVEKLKDVPFLHGWPGHGRHFHFQNEEEKREGMVEAADYMRTLY